MGGILRVGINDLEPDIKIRLFDDTTPVDLTPAVSIRVVGVSDGVTVIDRAATGDADGYVTLPLEAADTSVKRRILLKVTVNWPGSKPQKFPAGEFLPLYVTD